MIVGLSQNLCSYGVHPHQMSEILVFEHSKKVAHRFVLLPVGARWEQRASGRLPQRLGS